MPSPLQSIVIGPVYAVSLNSEKSGVTRSATSMPVHTQHRWPLRSRGRLLSDLGAGIGAHERESRENDPSD